MGVRNTTGEGVSAMFDSVTGTAFGPVFDTEAECDDFVEWAVPNEPRDLRSLPSTELDALILQWRGARAAAEAAVRQ